MPLTVVQNHPIYVTGTITTTNSAITTKNTIITGLYWYAPTTIGHTCILRDGNLKEIFAFKTVVANQSQYFSFPDALVAVDGLYCYNMDSGELYVFVR